MRKDNPASRLHEIMTKAREHGNHVSQRDMWKNVFETPKATDSQLNAKIGKVMALPEEIDIWVKSNFPTRDWSTWKKGIDESFSLLYLNGLWNDAKSKLTLQVMTELDMISALYETNGSHEIISQEELDEFKKKIYELKEEAMNSDISGNLKNTFVKYLSKILEAIDNYQLTGSEPILDAVEAAIGHVAIDNEYGEALKKTGTGDQLVTFLGSLVDAVASAQGLPPVATPFLQLIKSK